MPNINQRSWRGFLILALLGFLFFYNFSIVQKERFLLHGMTVVLRLAPVDPRSLMQGDYMVLEFEVERAIRAALREAYPDRNYPRKAQAVLLEKDGEHIFTRLYTGENMQPDEKLLEFTSDGGSIKIAGGSFFFEEGLARLYEHARFAEIRVDHNGKAMISNLLDDNKRVLDKSRWDAEKQRLLGGQDERD